MNELKQEMITDIIKLLQKEGMKLQEANIPIKDQLACLDVILDSIKFLRDYDENTKILNQHYINKKYNEKGR